MEKNKTGFVLKINYKIEFYIVSSFQFIRFYKVVFPVKERKG